MLRIHIDDELRRIRIMLGLMVLGFVFLGVALWRLQVAHGAQYQKDLTRQSVRRVRVPGTRGIIADRQGVKLADNRPSYCIAVYLEELRRPGSLKRTLDKVEAALDEVAGVIGRPREVARGDIVTHMNRRLPLPLLAWRDLDEAALARFVEAGARWPGFDVHVETVRVYPEKTAAAHALGYVGRADLSKEDEEAAEPFHYYLPEMIGRAGLEGKFDGILRGSAGGRLVRVDVAGYRHEDLAIRLPQKGGDLRLALDVRIQKLAEAALGAARGAAVVVDPNNGDVLALASSPGYDLNRFIPAISSALWNELLASPDKPLINRASAGVFAPGSTFKPVVALAALESGRLTPQTRFMCPGYYMLGQKRFRCWQTWGHGEVDLSHALRYSCNVYLFHAGLQCGPEYITHMAQALGLGQRTGISLDGEAAGLVPDNAWKVRTQGDGWRDGDTCNLSIGQGYLLATPLQMAMVCATLANGGTLYRPRLVLGLEDANGAYREVPAFVANELHWTPAWIRLVREGMRDVVNASDGTGRGARLAEVEVAAKTGTAEYGRKEEGRKLGWMIAFAPFEKPRYALALVVEEAVSGSVSAAPRIKHILEELFYRPAAGGAG